MSWPNTEDLRMLKSFPKEKLLKLFLLQVKNLWRVDGLYFLGIEEKFGTKASTEIDAYCWKTMGKIEARELKKALNIEDNSIPSLMMALKNTSWALYQTQKQIETSHNKGTFRVTSCRVQEARIRKGLHEFPCKKVRLGYLQNFAEEFNSNLSVICKTCPPDTHPKNLWCEWEFIPRT